MQRHDKKKQMARLIRRRLASLTVVFSAVVLLSFVVGAASSEAAPTHPLLGTLTGSETPQGEFSPAAGLAVDPAGFLYVASPETAAIYVYDAEHHYVTTISDTQGPTKLAVDSHGNVYVLDYTAGGGGEQISLYKPSSSPPTAATTYSKSVLLANGAGVEIKGVAVNPSNDHVDVSLPTKIWEFASATEGSSKLSKTIGSGITDPLGPHSVFRSIAIGGTGKIYVADAAEEEGVLVLNAAGTQVLHAITNTARPFKELGVNQIALDQSDEHLFVGQTNEVPGPPVVEEFDESGSLVSEIGPSVGGGQLEGAFPEPGLAVDNSSGLTSGNVYVASGFFDSQVYEFGALAQLFSLTVTKSGTGAGTVSGGSPADPSGIECGSVCTHEFASGGVVTLTATSAAGSEFAGWSGACSGVSVCDITLSEAKAVEATFALKPVLSVSKTGSGQGTVTSAPAGIDCGTTCAANFAPNASVTLTATPASGSSFKGWSGACSGVSTCTVTMNLAKSVAAEFDTVPSVTPPSTGGGGAGGGGGTVQTCATDATLCPPSTAALTKNAVVKGGRAQLKLTCKGPGACSGTLKLTAKLKTAKSKKSKTEVIGKSSFKLSAGGGTVGVRLTSAATKALEGGKSLEATVSGAGVLSGTVVLKLAGGK